MKYVFASSNTKSCIINQILNNIKVSTALEYGQVKMYSFGTRLLLNADKKNEMCSLSTFFLFFLSFLVEAEIQTTKTNGENELLYVNVPLIPPA